MQQNVKVIHLEAKNQQTSYCRKDSSGLVELEKTALEKDLGSMDGQQTEIHGTY